MEVSIQAVSPEFGEQLISILASHAGIGGSGSGGGGGAAGGVCADDGSIKLRIKPSAAMTARAMSATRANFLNVMELLLSKSLRARALQRSVVGLAGSYPHGAVDAVDEDLSVADLAGLGGRHDCVDDFVNLIGRHCRLDLDLGQEADGVFGAAINFGVALLTPVTFDLGDGHPEHPDRGQGVAHLVKLKRLDDSHDDLHGSPPAKAHPWGGRLGHKDWPRDDPPPPATP